MKCLFIPRSKFNYFSLSFFFTEENGEPKDAKRVSDFLDST